MRRGVSQLVALLSGTDGEQMDGHQLPSQVKVVSNTSVRST